MFHMQIHHLGLGHADLGLQTTSGVYQTCIWPMLVDSYSMISDL
jgi:hypothetical protein